jgi:hypothetical protein
MERDSGDYYDAPDSHPQHRRRSPVNPTDTGLTPVSGEHVRASRE